MTFSVHAEWFFILPPGDRGITGEIPVIEEIFKTLGQKSWHRSDGRATGELLIERSKDGNLDPHQDNPQLEVEVFNHALLKNDPLIR